MLQSLTQVREYLTLIELAGSLTPSLELGREFALRWDAAKLREGLVDFDDQIRRAAHLLQDRDVSAWIRYKLDRQFDHILIDEAQDTNAEQWDIVFALIDDFFDGLAAHEGKARTVFTVGDTKQAIFGFQGTSPRHFANARERVAENMRQTADAAREQRGAPDARYLREYGLGQSFRTADAVLDFVDAAIAALGPASFGLDRPADEHVGQQRPGLVTLWNTVTSENDLAEDQDETDTDEDSWLAAHDRVMADKIAEQIASWMENGFPLVKGYERNATPDDIMVLVRKRRELAGLIVARLHAKGVPVAGVDRLRLGAPLAVKDLMAAIRFAAQPLDDLNLANLLVSPLGRWTQDDLLEHGYRPKGVRLWHHLRRSDHPLVTRTLVLLRDLLRRVDYESPASLLHWILLGPMEGRRRLLARLGTEAADPIDELLSAAQAYAVDHTASLQGFIRWFDAGDNELKREAAESGNSVRVMTVHGAKGLQSPIVILADAAGQSSKPGPVSLPEPLIGSERMNEIPLPPLSKEFRVGPVALAQDAAQAREMEEHWRLLYVAMTRAEEALFIGGSLSPREKGEPHADSWYARLKPVFDGDILDDPIWGGRREWGERAPPVTGTTFEADRSQNETLPEWVFRPIADEPTPPRPLAPSGLGDAEPADPPLRPDEAKEAARRGTLIHGLLERLPDTPVNKREAYGRVWLSRHAADLAENEREAMLESAMEVISHPRFDKLFSAQALAEVPFSAIVGGNVVSGNVDRLMIEDEAITIIDYKTTRRPPGELSDIPEATWRQMAAYKAAFKIIYPHRNIRTAVLYTHTPQLFELPDATLDGYIAAYADT